MKNKASLVLMEQLVMILVFSLAAAACLQTFARADRMSREMQRRDEAVILCQNAAEALKAAGDLEAGAQSLGAVRQEDCWMLPQQDGRLELRETGESIPGLGQAEVRMLAKDSGETLFSLTVGWQEELP